jgi:hypothetical protein
MQMHFTYSLFYVLGYIIIIIIIIVIIIEEMIKKTNQRALTRQHFGVHAKRYYYYVCGFRKIGPNKWVDRPGDIVRDFSFFLFIQLYHQAFYPLHVQIV